MADLRQLTDDDVAPVHALATAAFADLDRRLNRPEDRFPPPGPEWYATRTRHLLATDPEGCVAVERDGELVGVAIAILREGVWGLSLLVVHPDHQSGGAGRELMDAALAYGADARARLILASEDPRAMRLYHRTGHRLVPSFDAHGAIRRRPGSPRDVRPGRWPEDAPIADEIGRRVRGAGYARDVEAYVSNGDAFLVHEGLGFAVHRNGGPMLLAASEDAVAAGLLRACLHAAPPDAEPTVMFVTHANDWAIEVCLDAGLELIPAGPVCVQGDPGPLAPWLPSGAFL